MTRIQRRRARGWRMPEGAVVVDRSTPWGNPFVVGKDGTRAQCVRMFRLLLGGWLCLSAGPGIPEQRASMRWIRQRVHLLRDAVLACWCPPSAECHADVLADLARESEAERVLLAARRRAAYAHGRRLHR